MHPAPEQGWILRKTNDNEHFIGVDCKAVTEGFVAHRKSDKILRNNTEVVPYVRIKFAQNKFKYQPPA